MRTLSVEWARFGIKLNALAAGQFGTDTLLTKYPKQIVDGVAASVPLQRMGEPEELAWLVAYLASPAGDFTTGSVITVDGARDNWMGPWPPQAIAGGVRQRGGRRAQAQVNVGRANAGRLRDDPRGARAVLGRARPAPGPPPGAGARVRRHVGGAARRRPAGRLPVRLRGGRGGLRAPGRACASEHRRQGLATRLWDEFEQHRPRARRAHAQGHHHAGQRDVDRLPPLDGHGGRARGRLRRARATTGSCSRARIEGAPAELDHVLVAVPEGGDGAGARRFYGGAIGLPELARAGGHRADGRVVRARRPPAARAGVRGLRAPPPARTRRCGSAARSWTPSAGRLEAAGAEVRWDDRLGDRRRFYTVRPVGQPGRGAGLPMTVAAVVVAVLVGAVLQSATGLRLRPGHRAGAVRRVHARRGADHAGPAGRHAERAGAVRRGPRPGRAPRRRGAADRLGACPAWRWASWCCARWTSRCSRWAVGLAVIAAAPLEARRAGVAGGGGRALAGGAGGLRLGHAGHHHRRERPADGHVLPAQRRRPARDARLAGGRVPVVRAAVGGGPGRGRAAGVRTRGRGRSWAGCWSW